MWKKGYLNLKYKTKYLLLLLMLMNVSVVISQSSQSAYVGQSVYFVAPNPPNNAALYQTAWGGGNAHVTIEKWQTYGCKVTVNSYFEGTAEIRCDYYYWYDLYGYQHTNHATTFFYVSCLAATVNLNYSNYTLNVGEGFRLSYSISPSNLYPSPTIRFYSTNPDVASVSESGYVRGIGAGRATIVAENSAGPDATCSVSVLNIDPTSVSISQSENVYVQETVTLYPQLTPSNAGTSFNWYTSDSNIASVSNGVVTGKSEGTAQVWCTTANGLRSNDCQVSVTYRKPTGISLSKSSLYLPLGQTSTLTYSLKPSNAKAEVLWETSDPSVAEVSQSGVVKSISPGKATITVKTDNGYKASCTVTVPPNPTGIRLPNKISLYPGKSRTLRYDVSPADAYHVLSWKSSDSQIVSVNSNGELTARMPGTTVVDVTTQNGIKASCTVEIPAPDYQFYVWKSQEEHVAYGLDEHPVVTYDDGKLLMTTKSYTVEWPQDDVLKFTVKDDGVAPIPTRITMTEETVIPFRESQYINVNLYPQDYDIEEELEWESDNPNVAVVVPKSGNKARNMFGNVYAANISNKDSVLIKAVGVGEAIIKATTTNGKTAQCHITVPEPFYYFYVYLNNGTETHYTLKDKPFVKYEENAFIIRTNKETIQYPASDVRRFMLQEIEENILVGINNSEFIDKEQATVKPGEVSMTGLKTNAVVRVYTMSGMLYRTYHADDEGKLLFSVAQWPKGIYIIKSNQSSYKINKK